MGDFKRRSVVAALAAAVAGGAVDIRTPISPITAEARCVSLPREPQEYMIVPDADKIQAIAKEGGLTLEQAGEKFLFDEITARMNWNVESRPRRYDGMPAMIFLTDKEREIRQAVFSVVRQKSSVNALEDFWIDMKVLPDDPAFAYFHKNKDSMIIAKKTAAPIVMPLRDGIQKSDYPWASLNSAYNEYSIKMSDIEAAMANSGVDRSDKFWAKSSISYADNMANDIIEAEIKDKDYVYNDVPILKVFGKREDAHRLMALVDSLRDKFKEEYLKIKPEARRIVYGVEVTSCGPISAPAAANVFWFGLPAELEGEKAVPIHDGQYVGDGYGLVELRHGQETYRMLLDDVLANPAKLTRMLKTIQFTDNDLHYRLETLVNPPKPQ